MQDDISRRGRGGVSIIMNHVLMACCLFSSTVDNNCNIDIILAKHCTMCALNFTELYHCMAYYNTALFIAIWLLYYMTYYYSVTCTVEG